MGYVPCEVISILFVHNAYFAYFEKVPTIHPNIIILKLHAAAYMICTASHIHVYQSLFPHLWMQTVNLPIIFWYHSVVDVQAMLGTALETLLRNS